jgi:hypothetical protein
MKLYTEQEVRDAIDMAREGVRSKDGIIDTLNFIKPPIELPSDEEIEKANPFVFGSKHLGTRDMDIWELGAIWMRDKIKGGNK